MRSTNLVKKLLGASSLAALSVGVAAVPAQQASATGVYAGGSSLSSVFVRQVLDCYDGSQVAGDKFSASSGFNFSTPTPGLLPASCGTAVSGSVEGLFASVGSGRGQQAFFTDDPMQLVNGSTNALGSTPTLPSLPPLYIDGNGGTGFNSYPYPELEFTASDSPLAATLAGLSTTAFTFGNSVWATATASGSGGAATVTIVSTAPSVTGVFTASYDNTKFGAPIQLPAFEVPVALGVNTNGLIVQSAGQQLSGGAPSGVTTQAGGAIQLDTAQVCAIFAGKITDWGSQASIDNLAGGSHGTELFSDANVNATDGNPSVAYTPINPSTGLPTSVPIHVIYRGDGSGTSFIITNYLKSSCLPLATTANKYSTIFSNGLPSTSFANLVSNVAAAGNSTAGFTAQTGTAAVASTINNDSGHTGNLGYISNDFAAPYSALATAPSSAAVQDEAERASGINLPSDETFPAPTPANADAAFAALSAPAAGATYAAWNIYAQTYTSGSLSGSSILGVSNRAGAYPIVGTTFLEVYSCYNGSTKTGKVTNFLNWYFNGANASTGPQPLVQQILLNNGFSPLNTTLAGAVYSNYLNTSSSIAIGTAGAAGACSTVTPGA